MNIKQLLDQFLFSEILYTAYAIGITSIFVCIFCLILSKLRGSNNKRCIIVQFGLIVPLVNIFNIVLSSYAAKLFLNADFEKSLRASMPLLIFQPSGYIFYAFCLCFFEFFYCVYNVPVVFVYYFVRDKFDNFDILCKIVLFNITYFFLLKETKRLFVKNKNI